MLSNHPLIQQMARFSVVGVSATVLDFVLLVFLTEVLGCNYLLSNVASFTVSIVVNYLASMRFVFEKRDGMRGRSAFARFVGLSVAGLVINSFCMWAIVERGGIDYRAAKVLAALIVSVWNFVTRKIFLEQRRAGACLEMAEKLTAFCASHARAAESQALLFLRDVLSVYDEVRSWSTACRLVRLARRG